MHLEISSLTESWSDRDCQSRGPSGKHAEPILRTISGSERSMGEAGSSEPVLEWTIPIEFSTVTNPDGSFSVLPRQGNISAVLPVTKWDLFILVEICTLRSILPIASATLSVSDMAETKFPPIDMYSLTLSSSAAWMNSTASYPLSLGISIPVSSSHAERKSSPGWWFIPTVRSPCTLE